MRPFTIILVFLQIIVFSSISFCQTLTLDGTALRYRHAGKSVVIKKLDAASDFYGYDLMDKTHIFIAYQLQNTAEAVAVLTIYNVETGKERELDQLGGAGESHFTYNRENKLVLYNIDEGMYTLKIVDPRFRSFTKPVLVLRQPEGKSFYKPTWIDARTFRYEEIDSKSGHTTIKKFTLPD